MAKERDPNVTSRIMSAVRSKDTTPEIRLRSELHRRGLRFRKTSGLLGRPDIVFRRSRVVVFVDGDFWHGHGWKARGFTSFEEQFNHRNAAWWKEKIERNVARDRLVNRTLRKDGWTVLRVLESEIPRDVTKAATRIERTVRQSPR